MQFVHQGQHVVKVRLQVKALNDRKVANGRLVHLLHASQIKSGHIKTGARNKAGRLQALQFLRPLTGAKALEQMVIQKGIRV